MNCADIQERLSAYHDGELPDDVAAQIAAHLANCQTCAIELASFESLSALSRQLTDPAAPKHLWENLEASLGQVSEVRTPIKSTSLNRVPYRWLAAAAMILIALTFVAYRTWFTAHTHQDLATNFDRYLDELQNQPEKAEQVLLANYEGRAVTLPEATRTLGYEPMVAEGLPASCSLEKLYILNMPCCKCSLAVCKQSDGHSMAVFEHDTARPGWFGDRATVECLCDGVPTSITQVNDKLAATWKDEKRYMTIIGARDLNEVTEFIAFYSRRNRSDIAQPR